MFLRNPPRSFGTALRLQHDPLFEELWRGDLKWVWFDDDNSRGWAEAARRQEIFLDYLASLASDTSPYLLNDRYKYLLSEEQQDLRKKLRSFAKEIDSKRFQELQAWQEIQDMLKRFGYKAAP